MATRRIGVVVRKSLHENFFQLVKSEFANHELMEIDVNAGDRDSLLQQFNSNEILLADPALIGDHIYELGKVKWIQMTWAGVDSFLKYIEPSRPSPSFILTRYGGVFGAHLSEYVIGNIVCMERKFFLCKDLQRKKEWWHDELTTMSYRLLSTLSISVLGCGDIGLEVAKHCKNFGMTVYGMITKLPDNRPDYVDKFFLPTDLPEFLKKSDYICNILPKTEKTTNILSGSVLQNCREAQSTFINIGRGCVLDDDSLTNAIEKGWLKAAILDVFNEEPLPRESKLWDFPNVFITPHIAGLSLDEEVIKCFRKNLQLYEEGKKLNYVFDWEKMY